MQRCFREKDGDRTFLSPYAEVRRREKGGYVFSRKDTGACFTVNGLPEPEAGRLFESLEEGMRMGDFRTALAEWIGTEPAVEMTVLLVKEGIVERTLWNIMR